MNNTYSTFSRHVFTNWHTLTAPRTASRCLGWSKADLRQRCRALQLQTMDVKQLKNQGCKILQTLTFAKAKQGNKKTHPNTTSVQDVFFFCVLLYCNFFSLCFSVFTPMMSFMCAHIFFYEPKNWIDDKNLWSTKSSGSSSKAIKTWIIFLDSLP